MNLVTQLQTVRFGQLGGPKEFLEALFCALPGVHVTNKLAEVRDDSVFVWTGEIPKKPGRFVSVAPYAGAAVRTLDPRDVATGRGFGPSLALAPCVVCAEADDLTLEAQCAAVQALVDRGLPEPNAVCLSGGKSVHFFWSCAGLTLSAKTEIQQLLCALLDSDPSVGDQCRKMRLGGVSVEGRVQTILHLDRTPRDPAVVRAALRKIAKDRGVDAPAVVAEKIRTRAMAKGATAEALKGESFDPDTLVIRSNFVAGTVTEIVEGQGPGFKVPCHCPHHTDSTPSAFLAIAPNGRPFINCSKCATTWHAAASSVAAFAPSTDPEPEAEPKKGSYVFGTVTSHPERHLLTVPYGRVNYIRSPRETGKTTVIAETLIRQARMNPEFRCLVLVHRVSLGTGYHRRLAQEGWVLYSECPKGPITQDKVVVCLDSLPRVQMYGPPKGESFGLVRALPWDCVFIDESEQLIRHIDSETIRKHTTPENIVDRLQIAFRNTDHLILADADLGGLTVETVRLLMGWDLAKGAGDYLGRPQEFLRVNDGANAMIGRKAEWYPGGPQGYARIHTDLMEAWKAGKRLIIGSTTKIEATLIHQDLVRARPDTLALLVTSDTSGGHKEFLSDPDKWTVAHRPDAVVYSPSMGTGFDLATRAYWDQVYCVAPVGTYTTTPDVLQSVERCRHPQDPVRRCWVEERELWSQTDPEKIAGNVVWGINTDLAIAVRHCPIGDTLIAVPHCRTTLDIVARVRAHRAQSQGNVHRGVRSEMDRCRWDVAIPAERSTLDVLEEELARLKAEKKIIRARETALIVEADPMPLDAAKAILDGDRRASTPGEVARARKALLVDLVGPTVVIDTALVKEWLSGKLTQRIELFVAVMAKLKGEDEKVNAFAQRQIAWWNRTSQGRLTLAQADAITSHLKRYLKEKCDEPILGGTLRRLGFSGFRTNAPTAQETVGVLLGAMGIRTVGTRQRSKEDWTTRTRTYTIDKASVARMKILSARWAERLVGRWTEATPTFEDPGIDAFLSAALDR